MRTDDLREKFLTFFERQGHRIVPSDSLIPAGDPTLLFSGAGMNQFKDYFLGVKKDLRRAASCQKCLRTGDLDKVGRTPYHHSFFEMLGNFSFGDYFKEEAIHYAFEFLTDEVRLPTDRLRVSVHKDDEVAYRIWREKIGIREAWISRLGDDTNFWPARALELGPNGPCGPCSEIYFDQGEGFRPCPRTSQGIECDVDCKCGRFAEIWNLVFTQFDRRDQGELVPLSAPNIDTGMGLERLACVTQGKSSNFEIDILKPLVDELGKGLALQGSEEDALTGVRLAVDHIRGATFAIADGAIPSNEGRGYVVRKLIRRAVWKVAEQARKGKDRSVPRLYPLVETIVDLMKKPYPYLTEEGKRIEMALRGEEERFLETLEDGRRILGEIIDEAKRRGEKFVTGETVFKLYDTYGFPDEVTASLAREEGLEVDLRGFECLMEQQRERGREATKIASGIFIRDDTKSQFLHCPASRFVGYGSLQAEGAVLFVQLEGKEGIVLLDQTPFYAEQGGQVGDQGVLTWPGGRALVLDTQWNENLIVHRIRMESGAALKIGLKVHAQVDENFRERTRRHHTATHLLQSGLRGVLGRHVRQMGSLINPEKLRFDFSHGQSMRADEVTEVESFVNKAILKNLSVDCEEKAFSEAQREGALAFFGEKYGERVRVVSIQDNLSKELCGGTHVAKTGDIGLFLVTKESSVASGVRRIEGVAGLKAMEWVRGTRELLERLARVLKVSTDEVLERVEKMQQRIKALEKGMTLPRLTKQEVATLIQSASPIKGVNLIVHEWEGMNAAELRQAIDLLRQEAKKAVIVLFSTEDGKVNVIVSVTPDLKQDGPDADRIVKKIAEMIQGSGGGRRDLAQGGSKNPKLVERAKREIPTFIREII